MVDRLRAAAARASRRPWRPRRPAASDPAVERPPRPVTPSAAASASAQTTWSARDRGRRGRSHSTRATTDGVPVPVASTLARRQPGQHVERHPAALGREHARQLGRQGVLRLPRGVAYADQAGHPARLQPGAGQGRPPVGDVARDPRVEGVGGQPGRRCARRRRRWRAARTPRPPRPAARPSARRRAAARPSPSAPGPRDRRCAARSAARCPSGRAAARPGVPPRRRRRPRPGRPWPGRARTSRPRAPRRPGRAWCGLRAPPARPRRAPDDATAPRGTSSRATSSSSAGVPASSGSTVCRADPAVAWPPFSSTWSSIARAAGLSSDSRRSTSSGGRRVRRHRVQAAHPGRGAGRESLGDAAEGAQPARCLPHEGQVEQPVERARRPPGVGVDHRRRLPSAGFDPRRRGHQGQRARAASAGRAHGQPTTGWRHATPAGWSHEGLECRDRDARGAAGRAGRRTTLAAGRPGCGNPAASVLADIPATLPGCVPLARPTGAGMRQVELHHGAATDVGLVREVNEDAYLAVAAGLRRRRRHGRARRRRRGQRDRGRGVRPAGRRRLRPAARRGRRRGHARRSASAGSRSTASTRSAAAGTSGTPAPPWSSPCWSRTTTAPVAAGQPRRLPHLPVRPRRRSSRSASTTASSRS